MAVYRLTKALVFPPCHHADPDGLLAVGGDLSPDRLLLAYRQGIFPWYGMDTPILWWSPDPRLVLFPDELKIPRSLLRVLRKKRFQVTVDRAFPAVIAGCSSVERKEAGTWIVPEMIGAYVRLHELGYAHSVESWQDGRLVGGLYGIALGRAFFGESMFSRTPDASKVALVHLVGLLARRRFEVIDCQVTTSHLKRFGAREIPRREFLSRLEQALEYGTQPGSWSKYSIDLPAFDQPCC